MSFTHKDLPQWLQEVTPEEVEDLVMKYDENEGFFYLNDEGMTTFSTIEDAYDYVNKNNINFVFDESVIQWCKNTQADIFEDEDFENENDDNNASQPKSYLTQLQDDFYEQYDREHGNNMITYKNDTGSSTALFENSSKKKIIEIVQDIKYFEQVIAKAYHENPDNFMYAYRFINEHPMFWLKQEFSNGIFSWITDGGIDELTHFFYNQDEYDDNSPIMCVIETGEHVAPKYKTRYFSPLLTVQAPTYEQAIIKCAARLAQFYNDNGEAKAEYLRRATQASNDYVAGVYSIEN